MNLESAILSSTARRSVLSSKGIVLTASRDAVALEAGRHSEKELPAAHKQLQQVLRTAGWVHKGTNNGVTGYKHKDGSQLIFHHPADDDDTDVTAAAVDEDTATDAQPDLGQKIDELISLLNPKKAVATDADSDGEAKDDTGDGEDPASGDADSFSLALGDHGFDHTNRHQIGDGRVVDVYNHPAGHDAVIQSKNGGVQGWGINYARGLGNSSGTDTNSLQQHLSKSVGFLRNEAGKATGKPGKAFK